MTRRPVLARAAAVTAVLPLAGGLLVLAAPAASAAVTAPGDGTVFTSYSTFDIRADYPRSNTDHRLTLSSPGGPAVTVASAPAGLDGGTMSYSLDTGCWTYPSSSCTGRRLAPNGTWTVEQTDGSSSTFVTRIRPGAPTSVSATALNPREVRVSWRAGDEPDLTGWAVLEGSEVVVDGVGRSACAGSTCSAVVTYATEGSGQHTFTVQAFRSVAPGSSSTLESPLSAPASARLDPPPPPPAEEPSGGGEPGTGGETGSGGSTGSGSGTTGGGSTGGSSTGGGTSGTGGSTGGSGGGTTTGGSTGGSGAGDPGSTTAAFGTGTTSAGAAADEQAVAQRKAFALSFSAFGPKLGIPKLPPLPQTQAPAIAPELPDGTFAPTLGFEDQVITERVPVAQGPTERVRNVVGSALDSERLVRSTAGALLLLLAGAHLRRWLGSAAAEDH